MNDNQSETADEWLKKQSKILEFLSEDGKLNEFHKITYLITQAMNTGRADIMDSLVALGLNTNLKDGSGETLMHMAISIGNTATMKWLKEHNVGVNEQNNDGDMPIHLAAGYGYLEVVKWLLDNGAKVDARGQNNRTPMHQAAANGKVDVMRYLKERGADLYARDDTNSSPMESAIDCNQTESIKCLKELGADVDVRNDNGQTPIFIAAIGGEDGGKIESIKCLAQLGADVNAKDNEGMTPILWAAQVGHVDSIKCLAQLGADINVRDGNFGATPMIHSALMGKFECLKCLADLGADVNAKDNEGMTPIDAANMGGHSEIAEWLTLKFIADFTEKIQLDPENAKAYECRGVVYSQRKDYDQAIADFTKAILLDTNFKNAYKMRGAAYGIKEEHDKSIADYEKALLIDPNDNSIAIALENARKLKKQAEENAQRLKKQATNDYDNQLKKRSEEASTAIALESTRKLKKQAEEAEELIKKKKEALSYYEMKRRFWIAFGIAMGVIVIGLALFFLTTPIPDRTLISKNNSLSKGIGIDMVFVKGGTFAMGCTQEQGIDCSSGDKPVRSVTVNDFQIGKYEVTQSQWIQVMGSNPSAFEGDDLPVEKVSWNDAQEFISKLNSITNKNYRLPTEAEWEYAARGGAKSKGHKYAGSNNIDEISWHKDNSGNRTHPVGTKQANELGIYDMSGNVWEWVNSASSPDSVVERGGSWNRPANRGQVSYRSKDSPNHGCYADGFRLAMSVQNTGSVTPGKYRATTAQTSQALRSRELGGVN